jgi:hypothetical protein
MQRVQGVMSSESAGKKTVAVTEITTTLTCVRQRPKSLMDMRAVKDTQLVD